MTVSAFVVLFFAGLLLALPHLAHANGWTKLAKHLGSAPRLFFGVIALFLTFSPHALFRYADDTGGDGGAAPPWMGRIVFGVIGIYLSATAIRQIARHR